MNDNHTITRRFVVCPRCHGSGRERVNGHLTAILCQCCGGHGKVGARYMQKLITYQQLAHSVIEAHRNG